MNALVAIALVILTFACGSTTEPTPDPCPGQETWTHSYFVDGQAVTDTLCLPKGASDWFNTGRIPR
jgi:hypothetical protein